MSELWTPTRTIKPFEKIAKEIERRGFKAFLASDDETKTVRIQFMPQTDRMAQRCREASEEDIDYFETGVIYGGSDVHGPGEAAVACLEKGLEFMEGHGL